VKVFDYIIGLLTIVIVEDSDVILPSGAAIKKEDLSS